MIYSLFLVYFKNQKISITSYFRGRTLADISIRTKIYTFIDGAAYAATLEPRRAYLIDCLHHSLSAIHIDSS